MKWNEYRPIWHRLWSIRLMILTTAYTAAAGAWVLLPGDWKPFLSEGAKGVLAGVGVLLPVASALAVVIKQNLPPPPLPTVPKDKDDA